MDEMEATSRKRQKSSGDMLRLVVRGTNNSEPSVSPEGMQEVKKWLNVQMEELQVILKVLACWWNSVSRKPYPGYAVRTS